MNIVKDCLSQKYVPEEAKNDWVSQKHKVT